MTTLRKEFLNTEDHTIKLLLDEMLGDMLNVQKGHFSYRFDIEGVDLMLTFKYDEMSDISFTPKDTVRDIAKNCDCLELYNLSEGAVEVFGWQYDGDDIY